VNGERDVQKKKKLTLSFEEYRTLSTMLVVHMRNEEVRAEREGKLPTVMTEHSVMFCS
jgi:hypothetical protein